MNKPTKQILILLLAGLWLLAGCRAGEGKQPADPTAAAAPTILPGSGQAAALRHADLLNSPSQYNGALVRVSGQFRRLPQLVCQGETFRSPASWKLTAGDLFIQAAGFETALRPLANSPQTITVQGRWLRWEGPVGCGDEARMQEIWYLDVQRVIEPNPILFGTQVAGTPPPPGEDGADPGQPAPPTEPVSPTATPDEPDESDGPDDPDGEKPPGEDEDPGDGGPPPTLPTLPSDATATPTAANGVTATPTPTGTTPPGQGGAPPPPLGPITDQGPLDVDFVAIGAFGISSGHAWDFSVQQSGVITISVIPDLETNIALTIERPDGGTAVSAHNEAGMGEPETVVLEATTGVYRLIVTAVNGNGSYAILYLDEFSFAAELVGNLRYGDSVSATMPEATDHYWHFSGTAGDVISIIVTPAGMADLLLALFDADGNIVGEYMDEGRDGEPEELRNITLPMTGYYSILLQEFYAEETVYRIELIRN